MGVIQGQGGPPPLLTPTIVRLLRELSVFFGELKLTTYGQLVISGAAATTRRAASVTSITSNTSITSITSITSVTSVTSITSITSNTSITSIPSAGPRAAAQYYCYLSTNIELHNLK